jgi:hypothetical protein
VKAEGIGSPRWKPSRFDWGHSGQTDTKPGPAARLPRRGLTPACYRLGEAPEPREWAS